MLKGLFRKMGGWEEAKRLQAELRRARRTLERQEKRFARRSNRKVPGNVTYDADGLLTRNKNTEFLDDPRFQDAYRQGIDSGHKLGLRQELHAEWRVHVALWAATHASKLPGDFVECGVNTGIYSLAIARYVDLNATGKAFWLFDTFAGIPDFQISEEERERGRGGYNDYYEDCYEVAKANFAPYPNAHLIRGVVPDTLGSVDINSVCYLSIDMNIVAPEIAAIEHFWPKLSTGAPVLLDDYRFLGHALQKEAMDGFAAGVGCEILTLPTGQGLLLKP